VARGLARQAEGSDAVGQFVGPSTRLSMTGRGKARSLPHALGRRSGQSGRKARRQGSKSLTNAQKGGLDRPAM